MLRDRADVVGCRDEAQHPVQAGRRAAGHVLTTVAVPIAANKGVKVMCLALVELWLVSDQLVRRLLRKEGIRA